jgi:putative ABC transport system permease protein
MFKSYFKIAWRSLWKSKFYTIINISGLAVGLATGIMLGIRKVLGASVSGIVALISKDFLKLVIIAIVIATPIAWLAMNKWLEGFAYRINITWGVFVFAGFLATIIALLTISFQAITAAVANPVESLRTE